jgi:hypothetical protein
MFWENANWKDLAINVIITTLKLAEHCVRFDVDSSEVTEE